MATPVSTAHLRITRDFQICHGQPVVRGLRYPVWQVLELLASGMSEAEILGDYPDLEAEDFRACQAYAASLLKKIWKALRYEWSDGGRNHCRPRPTPSVDEARVAGAPESHWQGTADFDYANSMKPSNKPSSAGSAANPTDFSMKGRPVQDVESSHIGKWMTEKDFFDHLRKTGRLPSDDNLI